MLPVWSRRSAFGSSNRSAVRNSRRVAARASEGRCRHTSTMLEASALTPMLMDRAPRSVRIGQVPVIANPDRITASRNVSQPVLTVPDSPFVSDCLNA